ncbi:MAG TPA: hypothetical protein VNN10_13335, partial [Dehalococcoidia bacterium]|nr:hypothetical protein [Dehalococcoidia bacterium]
MQPHEAVSALTFMDLSNLLPPVSRALGGGRAEPGRRLVLGVADAVKPAVIAASARDAQGPVLVVVARALRARDLVDELAAWLGADAARVRLFPERDTLPYERAAEDPWEVRERLDVIARLSSGGRPIVVACVEAVAQRTLSPKAAAESVSTLSAGMRLTPDDLLRRLHASGYEVAPLVEAPGQAARRGGIIDLFPPSSARPIRVEFFGGQVESIREFDPDTQRSQGRLDTATVGRAYEFSPDPAAAARLRDLLDFSRCSDDVRERITEGLDALADGDVKRAPPFLASLLSPFSLLDHLPAGSTVVLDEPLDLSRALDEYVAETATMRIEREMRGELPSGLPPAQANWHDLQPSLERHALLELARFATEESGAARPPFSAAAGYGGRVRVLARDLGEAIRGPSAASVVIVSQQASRLATILGDEGLPLRSVDARIDEPDPGLVQLVRGSLPHGWRLAGAR